MGQERRRLAGCFQSASNSSHVGAMFWKCVIIACIAAAVLGVVRRIGDDRVDSAVIVKRQRILATAYVASIDTA